MFPLCRLEASVTIRGVLFSVVVGGEADDFFEDAGEVVFVGKADSLGDLVEGAGGAEEEFLGLFGAAFVKVLNRREAHIAAEEIAKVGGVEVGDLGQLGDCHGLVEIFADILEYRCKSRQPLEGVVGLRVVIIAEKDGQQQTQQGVGFEQIGGRLGLVQLVGAIQHGRIDGLAGVVVEELAVGIEGQQAVKEAAGDAVAGGLGLIVAGK